MRASRRSAPTGRGGYELSEDTSMFPRIIREFDDGPDEKPMMYRRKKHG